DGRAVGLHCGGQLVGSPLPSLGGIRPRRSGAIDGSPCDDEQHNWMYKTNPRDIGVLNLEDDSREEIVSPLWSSWPSPIWITPSLTVMNLSLYK
uniref:Uncharacterized protein n=1 Tax=Aegilops tauschii subsp. strangulata TaxID=200361 RepID=A0A453HNV6_AEGTS